MAFWGIAVNSGKPYTHSAKDARGRLRISQATLATGSATKKSLVQCNVGNKTPVLLCALLPDKTESLQLDLEFDEAEDVIFSVIGPRGVYLTGYYVGHRHHSIMQDDTESFGEDIANSETQESNHCSDEDEYEDSFINDDEPEPLTPSPVSSSREEDDDDDDEQFLKKKKKKDVNGGRKRLLKKCQIIESDDDLDVIETDDDVAVIEMDDEKSSPDPSVQEINKSEDSGKKMKKEMTNELEKETEKNDDENVDVDAQVLDSKDDVNVDLVNDKEEEEKVEEVVAEIKSKPKKKKEKKGTSKEKMDTLPSSVNENNVLKGDKMKQNEEDTNNVDDKSALEAVVKEVSEQVPINEMKTKKKKSKKVKADDEKNSIDDVLVAKDDEKPVSMDVGNSVEESKPKRKRKTRGDSVEVVNKQEDDQKPIDNGNLSEEKKVKKKKARTSKTAEVEEKSNMEVVNEEESKKKTLSNGLVIEELVLGKTKSKKVAAPGKKVKVEYVVKLKENGQVIDTNGESPYKFRLGDKQVIEGLNVGLDGMKVGDKRRLTIPPSMSLGYTGTGENVPPNSWLVYDVEMCSIH